MLGSQPLLVNTGPIWAGNLSSLSREGLSQDMNHEPAPMAHQLSIPREQVWEVASFPKGDQVGFSREGVFVPVSIFGQQSDLGYPVQQSPSGPEITMFRRRNGGHAADSPTGGATAEQRWLADHRSSHSGQWVALCGDRLLSSGPNPTRVYAEAQSMGISAPFMAYVDPDEDLPFAGW